MNWTRVVALAAMIAYVSAQTCKDVENCDTCSNPGPKCKDCPWGSVISNNRESCLACPDGCYECTADANDVTTGTKASTGYYLKNGQCTYCGDGCTQCHEDATGSIVCDNCVDIGYAHDMASTGQPCIVCPSNCKKCSIQTDGSTRCSECWSYKGLGIRGYFLKKADYSCKSCPSYCEKCNDDGNGAGICTDCFANYTSISDPNQSAADGSKCLKCPSTCKSCSGEVKNGNTAKCTECYENMGNYLTDDECVACTVGCKNCDADGTCVECLTEYRLDEGACTACPSFCLECVADESTGEVTCNDCKSTYGPKIIKSVTCDSCGFSNCGSCNRGNDGTFSCAACKSGYAFNADNTQCLSCGTGCNACEWDAALNAGAGALKCTTCDAAGGYTANAATATGACELCPSGCSACDYQSDGATPPALGPGIDCSACTSATQHVDDTPPKRCTNTIANCNVGSGADATKCSAVTDCVNGYKSDDTCAACAPANCWDCQTTPATDCDTCADGYVLDTTTNTACTSCDVSNCQACTLATAATDCDTCYAGYIVAADAKSCIKCPSNCAVCSASGTSSTCTTCQVYAAGPPSVKAYILGDGTCKGCPSKCMACTWDASSSSTKCTTGQCEAGYVVDNDGQCAACPDHCNDCELDASTGSVICKANQCDTGYGRTTEKLCDACPYQCSTCEIDAGTESDGILYCTACKAGYGKNEDVCAKCPSNCAECSDSSGTMVCSACVYGYALDSSNVCVKCPSQCKECTAKGSMKCKECNNGYALAGDKASCVDCPTAAFDNCGMCTSIDASSGKANCTACAFGYTLQDEEEYIACVDAGSLNCGAGEYYDNEPECTVCSNGFTLKEYECYKSCYSCGDIEEGVWVEKSKCLIPAAGANKTENDAELTDCSSGICYAAWKDGKVQAGCLPETDLTGTCTGDRAAGETCKSTADAQMCEQCCSQELCNTFVQDLDGTTDSASGLSASVLALGLAALLAMRFN